MKKILVTGGCGYIGSHTVVELIKNGYAVCVIDNLSNSKASTINRIQQITNSNLDFVKGDIRDKTILNSVFDKKFDAVVHFAASKSVGESVQNPYLYYENNVVSLLNLIAMMRNHCVENLIFSSSCTVYGEPDQLPVTEDTPLKDAESPYGKTKRICEDILSDISKSDSSLKSIALRYFNPTGAHSSGLIGEEPSGVPNNLIPYILQAASGILDELKVFGDDYSTEDGSAIRDYIHVVDLARAHVIALKRLIENKQNSNYEYFNLGTGNGFSVLEIIKVFEKVNGVPVPYSIVGRRSGDIEKIYADNTKAKNDLGWSSQHGIEEMLKSSWKWQQTLNSRK